VRGAGVGALLLQRGNVVVNVAIGHRNPVLKLPLLQPGNENLVADVLAESGEIESIPLEDLLELGQVEIVLFRHLLHGLVERFVLHPQARSLRDLDLQPLQNEPFQNLLAEHGLRRQRGAALTQLVFDQPCAGFELAFDDDVVIDHRDDAIQLDDARGVLRDGVGQRARDEAGRK
jgi:hypothetical protein